MSKAGMGWFNVVSLSGVIVCIAYVYIAINMPLYTTQPVTECGLLCH